MKTESKVLSSPKGDQTLAPTSGDEGNSSYFQERLSINGLDQFVYSGLYASMEI